MELLKLIKPAELRLIVGGLILIYNEKLTLKPFKIV